MTIALLLCGLALGQSELTFDVASVKPAGPPVVGQKWKSGGPGTSEPGRVTFTGVPLSFLLAEANDVWQDQVVGPAWISEWTNRFTIAATMPPTTTVEQYRVMLRNLLAERFGVRTHREQHMRPGYELVIADGSPKLEEWKPGAPGRPGFPRMDRTSPKALSFVVPMAGGVGPVHYRVRDTMGGFTRSLGAMVNASNGVSPTGPQSRIVDRTGLTEIYEFDLEFTGLVFPAQASDAPADSASEPGPTVFHAIEKQLGLRLRKVKEVPVDVVVVDHAEKVPTEN